LESVNAGIENQQLNREEPVEDTGGIMNDDQSQTEKLKVEAGENEPAEVISQDRERVSLLEVLDRTLNKGAVVAGDVTISVANIDLIYLGLHLVITSVSSLPVNKK
jgi:hypothetical protein